LPELGRVDVARRTDTAAVVLVDGERFVSPIARAFLIGSIALLVVGIGLTLWRPGRVFGAGGGTLGSSLARKVGADGGKCRQTRPLGFACNVEMELGSGARRSPFDHGPDSRTVVSERSISGCVGVLDYVLPRNNTRIGDDLGY
jgi:hypothetical protein